MDFDIFFSWIAPQKHTLLYWHAPGVNISQNSPFFQRGKVASFGWSREEFLICHHIILINSGVNSLKVARIKLVSQTNLPWSTTHGSLFYIFKVSGNNSEEWP
jgi:hypothetical protein